VNTKQTHMKYLGMGMLPSQWPFKGYFNGSLQAVLSVRAFCFAKEHFILNGFAAVETSKLIYLSRVASASPSNICPLPLGETQRFQTGFLHWVHAS
jgi:hypothetical protein